MFGLAEVVDQEVASDCCDPRDESATLDFIRVQSFVHLYEHVLRQVLGIVGRSGKSIADVVDAPVISLDDFFPSHGVAADAASNQSSYDLGVFQPALPGTPGFSG